MIHYTAYISNPWLSLSSTSLDADIISVPTHCSHYPPRCVPGTQYLAACRLHCIATIIEPVIRTHVTCRTCASFVSARAIFITERDATIIEWQLCVYASSPPLGQALPFFRMSLNKYFNNCLFFALQDTRTHVVVELYDTERSYVEALQILVNVSIIDFKWNSRKRINSK